MSDKSDKIRILVIGRNLQHQAGLLQETDPEGFRVRVALGLIDALDPVELDPPDVILLDSTESIENSSEILMRIFNHYVTNQISVHTLTPGKENSDLNTCVDMRTGVNQLAEQIKSESALFRRIKNAVDTKRNSKTPPPPDQLKIDFRERGEYLSQILENLSGIIVVRDAIDPSSVYINRAFEKITGVAREEYYREPGVFLRAVHPDDRERVKRSWLEFLMTGGGETEFRFQQKDGSVRWVWARNAAVKNPDGEKVLVLTIAEDITQRKRSEIQLMEQKENLEEIVRSRTIELENLNKSLSQIIEKQKQTEEELRQAEESYRTIANFTFDWESWTDPDRKLLYVSPSCERITGYTAEEFMDDPGLLNRIILPDDLPPKEKHFQDHHNNPGIPSQGDLKFRITHRKGSIRWIEHSCQPVTNSQGQFLGVRGSNRDITLRKQIEEQNRQHRKELARISKETTLGEIAATIAHEINQPLTSILTNAQTAQRVLEDNFPCCPEIKDILSDIVTADRRAKEVIQRIRDLLGPKTIKRSRVDIGKVIAETITLLSSEISIAGISVHLELAEDLPGVNADRIQIQQVLVNLISNAIDAMTVTPVIQPTLTVSTRSVKTNDQVEVIVKDTGPGINPELSRKIFEPFVTTKPHGLGLGLVISNSIIDAHNGRLSIESDPGQGTRCVFSIPVTPEDSP